MKNGSKLASSPGFVLDLLGEVAGRARVASRGGVRLPLRVQTRVGRGAVHRRGGDQLAVLVGDEHGDRPGSLLDHQFDDRQRLLELHRDTLRDAKMTNRRTKSGSGCSATPSWGRRTRTRSGSSRTSPGRRRSCRSSSRSPGRNEEAVAEAALRYGYERWTTDWHDIVADPAIGLFDNGGPNSLHAEPTIAAAEAGKHVLCEKPLGRDADESYEIWQRVAATGVKHLCGFNYRFVPAVRLAREMIDAGELGEIRHFRGRYLQDWGDDPSLDTWRFQPDEAGSGALGDLGTHVVDLARFLVGEISTVSGLVRTFLPGRQVDDALEAAVEFEQGAVGTIEATRLALGRRNAFQWEINGSKGSLAFDMERLNELQVFRADGDRARGFKTVLVSEADHPFWDFWWPPGHIIGWGDTFVHEVHHLLRAIAEDTDVAPYGSDVRGRLPRRRGLRRDRPLERERQPRHRPVPLLATDCYKDAASGMTPRSRQVTDCYLAVFSGRPRAGAGAGRCPA